MKSDFFLPGIFTLNKGKGTRSIFAVAMLVATALLFACSAVATYDQAAYEHATSVKVDTLALIGKATGNYADNSAEINKVNLALLKAYEYDKGRPLNDYTRKQWELLLVEKQDDPKSGILPRFFNRWQKKGSLKQAAVDDEKQNVSDAFDIIIQSESGKTHP
jgi:hypothetical protein